MIRPRKSVESAPIYTAPLEGRGAYIRLDFNENTSAIKTRNQYPEYGALLCNLSEAFGIERGQVIITNGSSEAIFLVAFSFLEPGVDKAVTSAPTFALIPHYLSLCGANVIEVPVTDSLEFDVAGIETELKKGVKLAMFASPDNPTGVVLRREILICWLKSYPETLFVIDEAYGEFNPEAPFISLIRNYGNLLVLRTFSKAQGMAGSRLGFIAGTEELIRILARVKAPYSVNAHAVEAAITVLGKPEEKEQFVQQTLSRKKDTIRFLNESGFLTHSGSANFFLIKLGADAANFCRLSRENGVLVRDRSFLPKLRGMVRVSIGTQDEMGKFRNVVRQFQKHSALIFDLDDTLVDASKSYPEAVKRVVTHFKGRRPSDSEYWQLKSGGGFNDDWVAARELLARQNIDIAPELITEVGKAEYFQIAKSLEKLLVSPHTLHELRKRYRLFICTGRYRDEYEELWGEVFDAEFEHVYCVDDFTELNPKPAPDMLLKILKDNSLRNAWHVGNSVDDMRAAEAADIGAIAVATTLSKEQLKTMGAGIVLDSPNQLPGAFGL